MDLNGKTILITGGASGIGLEAARQFLGKGAKVIITGRNQEKLDAAKKLLPVIVAIKSDVSDQKDADSLLRQMEGIGGIDILYNNAGVLSETKNLGKSDDRHFNDAAYEIKVNYLSVIYLNNLFLSMLKSRPQPAIINTTSLLSYVPSLSEATYAASKVALRFYTTSLRKHLEAINSKLKIVELMPPLVATEMTEGRDDKMISSETLVKALISGLEKDLDTIRIGDTKPIYYLSRFLPKLAFKLVNPEKVLAGLR